MENQSAIKAEKNNLREETEQWAAKLRALVGGEPEWLLPHLQSLRAVFVLVSPEANPGQHLRLLGHLATHVDDPTFLEGWTAAQGRQGLRETLLREERSITLHVERDLPTAIWIDRAATTLLAML